jgi:hypothetical protein
MAGDEGARWAAAGAARVREMTRPERHVRELLEIYREAIAMGQAGSGQGSAA